MKILVVAHPDDEVIWFSPDKFDKIIICFCHRDDKPDYYEKRLKALYRHPLKNRIVNLQFLEANFWKENDIKEKELSEAINKEIKNAKEIYTHNHKGEYGHSDHKLVNKLVLENWKNIEDNEKMPLYIYNVGQQVWGVPEKIIKNNSELALEIKKIYQEEGVWTWYKNWQPPTQFQYTNLKKYLTEYRVRKVDKIEDNKLKTVEPNKKYASTTFKKT